MRSDAAPLETTPETQRTQHRERVTFLQTLLDKQRDTAPAVAGAIMRAETSGHIECVCTTPPTHKPGTKGQSWIARAIEVIRDRPVDTPRACPIGDDAGLYGEDGRFALLILPLPMLTGGDAWYGVYLIDRQIVDQREAFERLALTSKLVSLDETERSLQHAENDLAQLARALRVVSASGEHDKFRPAALAACNAIAEAWGCDRVSIGFVRGRRVVVEASSHAEKISARSREAQRLESAMEECLDQDIEVIAPTPDGHDIVARLNEQLLRDNSATCVLSMPLRAGDGARGAITLERSSSDTIPPRDVEALRLTLEFIGPRLDIQHEASRPLPVRTMRGTRRAVGVVLGPEHTWAKLVALLLIGFLAFAVFAHGQFRVRAPFRAEAAQLYQLPAPFEGHLRSVLVGVDDKVVEQGELLAQIDTDRLRLERSALMAERTIALRRERQARNEGDTPEALMARAEAERAEAEIQRIDVDMDRAAVRAPVAGRVLKGDLKTKVGAPVGQGDLLFELAAGDELRVDVFVSEDLVRDVRPDQRGELAAAAYPARKLSFTVLEVDPAAQVREGRNVFRVRAQLDERPQWMRPGMEGVARIAVEPRPWIDIWTRPVVDWVRMKLWI
jgi:hypothetical protein